MDKSRVAKMTENVVASGRSAAETEEDDAALANVDQAFDTIIAAIKVIDDNLPNVKADTVPKQAARDAIKDLMDTAISPYMSDALKAMATFGE